MLSRLEVSRPVTPLPVALWTVRWDAMGEANECVVSGTSKLSMDPASFNSIQGRLRTIKFGLGDDALDQDGKSGLLCTAVLHTRTKSKVGTFRFALWFFVY